MSTWSPLLLKVLLTSLTLSILGYGGIRLLNLSPLKRQRNFISLIMFSLLLLPIVVWIGPRMIQVSVPAHSQSSDMMITFSQNLIVMPPQASAGGMGLLDITITIWLAGTLLGVISLLWGIWGVYRHIRRSHPLSIELIAAFKTQLPELSAQLPLHRVRLSDTIKGPVAAGFLRPWIIVPTRLFEQLNAPERYAVILHEWAHIESRDGLFSLIGQGISRLYWWNPLIKSLRKHRENLQELICDQLAASHSGSLHYAKALLSLAEKSCRETSLLGIVAFFGPISLKERIEKILKREGEMNTQKMQKGAILIGTLAMALMLVASGTEFISQDTEGTSEELTTVAAVAPESGQAAKDQEKPMRVSADNQPKLIKRVEPEYPKEALKKGISGQVILAAIIDLKGRVEDARVVSGHPLLNEAAIKALKQWEYKPFLVDGQAKRVEFTVKLKFQLFGNKEESGSEEEEPVRVASTKQPILIKRVEPVYPQEALEARVQGQVFVEATAGLSGTIINAVHLPQKERSEPEYKLLVDSAIAAAKQWKYEPYIINGKAKPVRFTIIMTFKLGESKNKNK